MSANQDALRALAQEGISLTEEELLHTVQHGPGGLGGVTSNYRPVRRPIPRTRQTVGTGPPYQSGKPSPQGGWSGHRAPATASVPSGRRTVARAPAASAFPAGRRAGAGATTASFSAGRRAGAGATTASAFSAGRRAGAGVWRRQRRGWLGGNRGWCADSSCCGGDRVELRKRWRLHRWTGLYPVATRLDLPPPSSVKFQPGSGQLRTVGAAEESDVVDRDAASGQSIVTSGFNGPLDIDGDRVILRCTGPAVSGIAARH